MDGERSRQQQGFCTQGSPHGQHSQPDAEKSGPTADDTMSNTTRPLKHLTVSGSATTNNNTNDDNDASRPPYTSPAATFIFSSGGSGSNHNTQKAENCSTGTGTGAGGGTPVPLLPSIVFPSPHQQHQQQQARSPLHQSPHSSPPTPSHLMSIFHGQSPSPSSSSVYLPPPLTTAIAAAAAVSSASMSTVNVVLSPSSETGLSAKDNQATLSEENYFQKAKTLAKSPQGEKLIKWDAEKDVWNLENETVLWKFLQLNDKTDIETVRKNVVRAFKLKGYKKSACKTAQTVRTYTFSRPLFHSRASFSAPLSSPSSPSPLTL
eukprot:CAMPEP_0184344888 /NCGR_PEP_ID=MMETSP1089-20130417/13352_1 /TAXON_ID=38269 ORGANISM="Gloeochaete wittrockiana, Strain SAG46.84" /NCGR_SAMPLE_ID=MMETSP1089 /ASSEMBLY_ACC=CAM_ASM_000445 /LENGTH=319 /DNA_ID=CAMNT_0026674947 /DNA_START=220 /DNA_END=1176 /DNA_ORIENTATION=+